MQKIELQNLMITLGKKARIAAETLCVASTAHKNNALIAIAKLIQTNQQAIIKANQKDLANANKKQLSAALMDRLTLNPQRMSAIAESLYTVAKLPDPVNKILASWYVPSGLKITRISTPIGIIGVIYESRPNVTADAAALCLKAGNCVILRGGSEATHSNNAIHELIQIGLREAKLPVDAIQFVPTHDRKAVGILLEMTDYVDVIIPRGGPSLIKRVSEESKIPIFKHFTGLCHTYIHQDADIDMAVKIICNAKMRRTGVCGATETILIDRAILPTHAQPILNALFELNCEIRGDSAIQALDKRVNPAEETDWSTEYLDAIVSIKVVTDIDAAIAHIKHYGSQHTEAIITNDTAAAEKFFKNIDSAIVMHNTSTQFADGGEFGMGAEIGIATGKLHARGPVGVEQLTTFKYLVEGSGQIRA